MKPTNIISKFVLLLFFITIGMRANAQDPELLENTWYLQQITLNGNTTEATHNPEMKIQAVFSNNTVFNEMCCAGTLSADITHSSTESTFEINNLNSMTEVCDESTNNELRDLFVTFFENGENDNFEYNITTFSSYLNPLLLTLTNSNGDSIELYNSPYGEDISEFTYSPQWEETGEWYLLSLSWNGNSYNLSNDVAEQTTITIHKDGGFTSTICGEINAKIAFDGDEVEGSFYLFCENLTYNTNDCEDDTLNTIEQDFFNILQYLSEGHTFEFYRYHGDGDGFCAPNEHLVIEDPDTNTSFELIECLESLSINTYNKTDVSLYPNPAKTTITIEGTDATLVEIFSLSGKKVLESHNTNTVDISQFANGVYLVKVYSDAGVAVKKLVKQ